MRCVCWCGFIFNGRVGQGGFAGLAEGEGVVEAAALLDEESAAQHVLEDFADALLGEADGAVHGELVGFPLRDPRGAGAGEDVGYAADAYGGADGGDARQGGVFDGGCLGRVGLGGARWFRVRSGDTLRFRR